MKTENATPTPIGLSQAVLAAALALVLSNPVYAADPEPMNSHTVADRAAITETLVADNSTQTPLMPFDPSHAPADAEITRSIHNMLVRNVIPGTSAHNVTVITVNGVVTLRGTVANAEEEARIVAIAKEAGGGLDRLVNELQVINH